MQPLLPVGPSQPGLTYGASRKMTTKNVACGPTQDKEAKAQSSTTTTPHPMPTTLATGYATTSDHRDLGPNPLRSPGHSFTSVPQLSIVTTESQHTWPKENLQTVSVPASPVGPSTCGPALLHPGSSRTSLEWVLGRHRDRTVLPVCSRAGSQGTGSWSRQAAGHRGSYPQR
jgi:hypothetical protein